MTARERAVEVMDAFAERTGLASERPPNRYLWTDAFAVCNWLGLHAETGEVRFLELAIGLVDQVHRVLGRHRADDERTGWISGLSEHEGTEHPTAGGLRIGKPRNERRPDQRYDPRAEWDRDGQYYHYLTKWMFALNRTWRVTGESRYHRWGTELARAAHDGFVVASATGRRLVWKMSVDLSRPLVPSSGHHDPLDGLITTSGLVATRPGDVEATILGSELEELRAMCRGASWITEDPLGIGGLLVDALRCAQLAALGHPTGSELLGPVLADCRASLARIETVPFLRGSPSHRLAFRELGLALGLKAADRLDRVGALREGVGPTSEGPGTPSKPVGGSARVAVDDGLVEAVRRFGPLAGRILDFWALERSREAPTWREHRDISEVMWATCLAPDGFLSL